MATAEASPPESYTRNQERMQGSDPSFDATIYRRRLYIQL
jgi:hypothetical protein